jgi:hypothetical protein
MLVLALVHALTFGASCDEKCSQEGASCMSHCGTAQKCMMNCNDRQSRCAMSCQKSWAKAESAKDDHAPKGVPCVSNERGDPSRNEPVKLRPCTDEESKKFKDAEDNPNVKKLFKCKDAQGEPAPCQDDFAKAKDAYKKLQADGKICTDDKGNPTVCPDQMKKMPAATEDEKATRRMSQMH